MPATSQRSAAPRGHQRVVPPADRVDDDRPLTEGVGQVLPYPSRIVGPGGGVHGLPRHAHSREQRPARQNGDIALIPLVACLPRVEGGGREPVGDRESPRGPGDDDAVTHRTSQPGARCSGRDVGQPRMARHIRARSAPMKQEVCVTDRNCRVAWRSMAPRLPVRRRSRRPSRAQTRDDHSPAHRDSRGARRLALRRTAPSSCRLEPRSGIGTDHLRHADGPSRRRHSDTEDPGLRAGAGVPSAPEGCGCGCGLPRP